MTCETSILLSTVAGFPEPEMVQEADALRPGTEPRPIIVELRPDGRTADIVDGYHRVAGYCRWADDHDLPYNAVLVNAVVTTDKALVTAAADGWGPEQDRAINNIYNHAAVRLTT